MKVLSFALLCSLSLLSCQKPQGPYLAMFLRNGQILTGGPKVQLFTSEGKKIQDLEDSDIVGEVSSLPNETGLVLFRDHHALIFDESQDYHKLVLDQKNDPILAVTMPLVGRFMTISQSGVLQTWQGEQKVSGSTKNVISATLPLQKAVFSADGRWLVTYGFDSDLAQLWDVAQGKQVSALSVGSVGILSASFRLDGNVLLLGTKEGNVWLWYIDPKNGTWNKMSPVSLQSLGIQSVTFSHQNSLFATGDEAGTIRIWEYDPDFQFSPRLRETYFPYQISIDSVRFSFDDQTLISVSQAGEIKTQNRQMFDSFSLLGNARVPHLQFQTGDLSPDGMFLVTTSPAPELAIRLWSVPQIHLQNQPLMPISSFTSSFAGDYPIHKIALFSPDGNFIVSGGSDGLGRIWGVAGKEMAGFPGPTLHYLSQRHQGPISALAISSDGKLIATGSEDRTVKLWSLQSATLGQFLATLSGHTEEIISLHFSTENSLLVTISWDHSARLWNITNPENPQFLATLNHEQGITDTMFFANSTQLITAGEEGELQIWDIRNPQTPTLLTHHSLIDLTFKKTTFLLSSRPLASSLSSPFSPVFSLHTFFSGTLDGQVLLWDDTHLFPLASFMPFSKITTKISFLSNSVSPSSPFKIQMAFTQLDQILFQEYSPSLPGISFSL